MQKERFTKFIAITVATLFVGGLLLGGTLLSKPGAAYAQEGAAPPATQRYITVVGEGTVNVEPDIARATIGVETVSNSVKEAGDENQAIIVQVMDALTAASIATEDMQTANFNIYAEQLGPMESTAEGLPQVRYHVTNQVQVVIRDIEGVGDVLDAAIEAGANSIYGVEFRLEDRTAVQAEARARAVDNAAAKAEALAGLNGVAVGEVLSISEVIGSGPFFAASEARVMDGLGGGTPIQAGQLQVTSQVQLTYALE